MFQFIKVLLILSLVQCSLILPSDQANSNSSDSSTPSLSLKEEFKKNLSEYTLPSNKIIQLDRSVYLNSGRVRVVEVENTDFLRFEIMEPDPDPSLRPLKGFETADMIIKSATEAWIDGGAFINQTFFVPILFPFTIRFQGDQMFFDNPTFGSQLVALKPQPIQFPDNITSKDKIKEFFDSNLDDYHWDKSKPIKFPPLPGVSIIEPFNILSIKKSNPQITLQSSKYRVRVSIDDYISVHEAKVTATISGIEFSEHETSLYLMEDGLYLFATNGVNKTFLSTRGSKK